MQKRTLWSFGLFVASFLAMMVTLFTNLYGAIGMRKTISREREALLQATRISSTMETMVSDVRAYLLSGDDREVRDFETDKNKLAEGLSNVVALTKASPEVKLDPLVAKALISQEVNELERIIELKRENSSEASLEMTRHFNHSTPSKALLVLVDIASALDQSVNDKSRYQLHRADTRIPLLWGISFSVMLLLGIALFQLRREWKTRENALKELETSDRRLKLSLEAGRMGIWDLEIGGSFGHWEGFFREIFGVNDFGEINSREKLRSFVHEDDRAWVRDQFDQTIRNAAHLDIEFRIRRKDGQVRWVRAWAKVPDSENSSPRRMIGGVMDVTDWITARETIARQEKSIHYTSKMAALGEMAGGIAHEINTPLAIISGQAELSLELLESGEATNQQIIHSLRKIKQWVGQTAKIIQGLRQFSRDGTHDPFRASRLSDILDKTLDLCRETFKRHSVRLEVEAPSFDVQIQCRPVQISQVLLNLLQNAIFAAEFSKNPWVRVEVQVYAKEICFRISDSGPGVPVEIRDKIMQPFFTTKEPGKGTGLGLSISKGLVDGHRGHLYLDTECSHTCFVVKLPLYLDQEQSESSPTMSPSSSDVTTRLGSRPWPPEAKSGI